MLNLRRGPGLTVRSGGAVWRILLLLVVLFVVALYLFFPPSGGPSRRDSSAELLVAQRYVAQLARAVTQYRDSTGDWPQSLDELPRSAVVAANASISAEDRDHVRGGTPTGRGNCEAEDGSDCSAYSRIYRYAVAYHCCEWPMDGGRMPDSHLCSDPTIPRFGLWMYNGPRHTWNWTTAAWQSAENEDPVPQNNTWSFSAPDDSTAWGAAAYGLIAKTTDGGRTCRYDRLFDGSSSSSRADVDAVTPTIVFVLGGDNDVRIYKTSDGGATWKRQFKDSGLDPVALRFSDPDHGIALAMPGGSGGYDDAVEKAMRFGTNRIVILRTDDGGSHWGRVKVLPELLPGEIALERSLTLLGPQRAWFGTRAKGDQVGRIFRTVDGGRTWSAVTPLAEPSDGMDQIAFRDSLNGVALACGYQLETFGLRTHDGGESWTPTMRTKEWGQYCYGLAYLAGADTPTLVLTGAGHIRYSSDEGETWKNVDTTLYRGIAPTKPWRSLVGRAGWVGRWAGPLLHGKGP